eukprot:scaffold12843_cov113-Isochrysis_galbana.AAC.9
MMFHPAEREKRRARRLRLQVLSECTRQLQPERERRAQPRLLLVRRPNTGHQRLFERAALTQAASRGWGHCQTAAHVAPVGSAARHLPRRRRGERSERCRRPSVLLTHTRHHRRNPSLERRGGSVGGIMRPVPPGRCGVPPVYRPIASTCPPALTC